MKTDWKKDYARYKSFLSHITSQYRERPDIKTYIEMLLSLITISIFSVFALRPTLLTIAQLMKDIDTKKQTLALLDTKMENVVRAQSLYQEQSTQIRLLESAIPKTSEPDVFLRQIEGIARTHNAEVTSVSMNEGILLGQKRAEAALEGEPSSEVPGVESTFESTEFSITGTATLEGYQDLTLLLTDLEKLREPLIINEIRITRNQDAPGNTSQLVMFIHGKIPYLLPNSAQSF